MRAWPYRPGVPAAGHVTAGGHWHPGAINGCPKCRPYRNERVWRATHEAHRNQAEVAVWKGHEVVIVGEVIGISDTDFLVASTVNQRRESFRFDDSTLALVIER